MNDSAMAPVVSYRLSKKPGPPKHPLLSVLRRGIIDTFIGGKVPTFRTDTAYPMKFAHVYPGGHIGFLVPDLDPRRTDNPHLGPYENDENLKSLKFPEDKVLEMGMMLVVYKFCNDHHIGEMFRGLVEAYENDSRMVTLYLVDYMEKQKFSRNELYYVTPEYYVAPYLSNFGRLEGIEFFTGLPLLDKIVTELVTHYFELAVKVQYTANNEDIYDVTVNLPGTNNTLNELVLSNLIELAPGKFPKEGMGVEACVSHAESSGEVFVQLEGGIVQHVSDWITDNARDRYESFVSLNESDPKQVKKEIMYMAKFEDAVYRARVVEFVDRETVTVQYVDFGNYDDVPVYTLVPAKEIHPMLERLPQLCFEVYLKGVKKILDADKLVDLSNEVQYQMIVQKETIGDIPVVVMVNLSKDKHDDAHLIHKLMIKNGWAN